jgi:hypothetical protein
LGESRVSSQKHYWTSEEVTFICADPHDIGPEIVWACWQVRSK